MRKIFVSYSRADYLDENGQLLVSSPVGTIIDALKASNNIEVWIDVNSNYSGQYFTSVLAKKILWADVILFLSSHNSNSSKWVSKELLFAHDHKKEILPIRLDDSNYNLDIALILTGIEYIEYYKNPKNKLLDITENVQGESQEIIDSTTQPPSNQPAPPKTNNNGFPQNLFREDFHPIINMGIATQLATFTIILLMELWTLSSGCLAFYHHPQISHIMLCLSTGISLFATAQLHTLKSYWLGIIAVADFVDIYLLGILGEYLYENWHTFSDLSSPTTMRYQLLYYLGNDMQYHNFMGLNSYLLLLVIGHIMLMCLAFNFKRNGSSGWDLMS